MVCCFSSRAGTLWLVVYGTLLAAIFAGNQNGSDTWLARARIENIISPAGVVSIEARNIQHARRTLGYNPITTPFGQRRPFRCNMRPTQQTLVTRGAVGVLFLQF